MADCGADAEGPSSKPTYQCSQLTKWKSKVVLRRRAIESGSIEQGAAAGSRIMPFVEAIRRSVF
jgi:hypothetical protein